MNATRIMRYRDSSKMDPVIAERCVKMALSDAFGGFQYSRTLPTPFACARWGHPCHFSAVAASSESTIRTRNTGVTGNSIRIRRGFYPTPGALMFRTRSKKDTSAAVSAVWNADIHKFRYLMQWFQWNHSSKLIEQMRC